jgi:hypothetical protein
MFSLLYIDINVLQWLYKLIECKITSIGSNDFILKSNERWDCCLSNDAKINLIGHCDGFLDQNWNDIHIAHKIKIKTIKWFRARISLVLIVFFDKWTNNSFSEFYNVFFCWIMS